MYSPTLNLDMGGGGRGEGGSCSPITRIVCIPHMKDMGEGGEGGREGGGSCSPITRIVCIPHMKDTISRIWSCPLKTGFNVILLISKYSLSMKPFVGHTQYNYYMG